MQAQPTLVVEAGLNDFEVEYAATASKALPAFAVADEVFERVWGAILRGHQPVGRGLDLVAGLEAA
jgi:hypothetical protein